MLVAVGRRAFQEGLGLAEAGVATDDRGRINVGPHFETSVPGIFAIGDVVAGAMLAHKASEEGIACVERMAGIAGHVNYLAIPSVVYTWPELASVGLGEEAGVVVRDVEQHGLTPFGEPAHDRLSGADADVPPGPRHDEAVDEMTLAIVGERFRHEVDRRVFVGDERRGVHQIGDGCQDQALSVGACE